MQLKKLFNCIGILYIFNCSCSCSYSFTSTISCTTTNCARICCIFNWNTVFNSLATICTLSMFHGILPHLWCSPNATASAPFFFFFLMLMNGQHQMVSISWLLAHPNFEDSAAFALCKGRKWCSLATQFNAYSEEKLSAWQNNKRVYSIFKGFWRHTNFDFYIHFTVIDLKCYVILEIN